MARRIRMSSNSATTRKFMKEHKKAACAKPKLSRSRISSSQIKPCKIAPGTVLILLAGRFRGHRVVFLKQLEKSGLLLVSGPMRINGVPLRRVNRAYVIATSTKVDMENVIIPEEVNDDFFKREDKKKHICSRIRRTVASGGRAALSEADAAFFCENRRVKTEVPEHKRVMQRKVDAMLMPKVNAVEYLRGYLASPFSLSKGEFPHLLKF